MASNNIDQHSSGGQNAGAEPDATNIDPIWTTSRTARQIYALGEVEKDISRLLSLAASSISLLTLPQTDGTDDKLPQGEERSELFVLEVSEYFGRLDAIQLAIRSSIAHIRHSRIAPSAINAPPPGFVPPSLGMGLPGTTSLVALTSAAGNQGGTGSDGAGDSNTRSIYADNTGSSAPTASLNELTRTNRGLQEERVERDAWKGILDALVRLKAERDHGQWSIEEDAIMDGTI